MAERVFRILANLYKNLTDCADKSSAGTAVRKEFIRRRAFVYASCSASKVPGLKKLEI